MDRFSKKIVTDEEMKPLAVQIDYNDWIKIEAVLNRTDNGKPPTDLAGHIGNLDWPVDGMEFQRSVRNEWD